MLRLSDLEIIDSREGLKTIPEGKVLINTINAHSFNTAQGYPEFAEALTSCPQSKAGKGGCCRYLIPDGYSVVWACKLMRAKSRPMERVAGWDLFEFEMRRLNGNDNENSASKREQSDACISFVEREQSRAKLNANENKKKVMFMGSSERVLERIRKQCKIDYPNLEVVTYSPPYKPVFTDEDNAEMVKAINEAQPDLLWIGMTAPKQEVWTYTHWEELDIHCHVGTIGAVFDFFAGTAPRAPQWMQKHAQEWLFRLMTEPRRMWKRYLLGNPKFFWNILKESLSRRTA